MPAARSRPGGSVVGDAVVKAHGGRDARGVAAHGESGVGCLRKGRVRKKKRDPRRDRTRCAGAVPTYQDYAVAAKRRAPWVGLLGS